MHSKPNYFTLFPLLFITTAALAIDTPQLGKKLTEEEVNSISITISPNGKGLPHGFGNAIEGESIYKNQCIACHGDEGKGGVGPKLAGMEKQAPFWSTGSSWPYATSIYDYTWRAMPQGNVKSLTPNELYSTTAYILYLNGIIDKNRNLNQNNISTIKMPAQGYMSSKWSTQEKAKFNALIKK